MVGEIKKDKMVEYLRFICQVSDEHLSKDIINNSNVIYTNNEVSKLIRRLKKTKKNRPLIQALHKSKINIAEDKKIFLYSIVFFILFGWLWGLFLTQEKARQKSEKLKEEIKEFKAKIIKIVLKIE